MPARLTGFSIDPKFKGGAAAIFTRNLPEPRDTLIVPVTALKDKAEQFAKGGREADAALMRRALKAATQTPACTA